jgi:hypothetical protein
MARRKGRRPSYITPPRSLERKRSLEVPLYLIGAAVVFGYPMLRDATADSMLRNRYGSDRQSCECDYGPRCSYEGGQWYGPWYARNAADRASDDPGWGQCYAARGTHGTGGAYASYRGPTGVERGYRGGFGATGRVRAAGS